MSETELTEVSYVDALGQPIQVPHWFPGTLEEFAAEVAKLKPDQCSWPSGQRAHPGSRRCCTGRKTKSGVCLDHVHALIPTVHGKDMSKDRLAYVVRSIQDPKLNELTINTFYAEENLERAAKKCRDGGLSTRSLDLLRDLTERARGAIAEYREAQKELVVVRKALELAGDEKDRRKLTEESRRHTRELMEAFDDLSFTIKKIDKLAKTTKKDEDNWRDLARVNAESVEIKKQVAQVESLKRDQLSRDEVNASFQSLIEIIEDVVRLECTKAKANKIMETILQRTLESTNSLPDEH